MPSAVNFIFLLPLVWCNPAPRTSENATLVLVHTLWRHGDRTPTSSFLNTSEAQKIWPEGYGELTKRGMDEQFHLGSLLNVLYRKNQTNFMADRYSAAQVYVRSTDYNRTLMSAMSNMAAFFASPPNDTIPDAFEPTLQWYPVPIHTVERSHDPMLWANSPCAKVDQRYKEIIRTPPFSEVNNNNTELFKYLSDKAGKGYENLTLDTIWKIQDPLKVQLLYNKTWPDWMYSNPLGITGSALFKKIDDLNDYATKFLSHDEQIVPFRGGVLLKDILDRLKKKVENTLNWTIKYYAYSAHDITIVALLEALRAYPGVMPDYSACVSIELWQSGSNYFIKVLYRHTYETDTFTDITSNVTGCRDVTTMSLGCPFDSFHAEAKKWAFDPNNTGVRWTEQCQLDSTTTTTTATSNPTSSAKDSTPTGATSPATSKTSAVTGISVTLGLCSVIWLLSYIC